MKRILLCCITFLACQSLMAQEAHFGFKAGLNGALLTVKNQGETEIKPGFHAGGLAHIHVSDHLALQPELMYSGQGGKRISGGTEYNTNLHYLNLPVLLQYMFHNGFRIQGGPQIGLLLKANQEVNDQDSNVIENYKALDVSLPVGVSYVSDSGLGVDLRWAFGLKNINDVNNGNPSVRNQVGQLGIFYLLNYRH